MKKILILTFLFFTVSLFSQKGSIEGTVKDKASQIPLSGVKIVLNSKFKVLSDGDGKFKIYDVPYGSYNAVITAMELDTITKLINVNSALVRFDFTMGGSIELEEVRITGNLVSGRETPIAVTTVNAKKIQEELGSQDLPMLLSGTPGVQATQSGGGDGDSRIVVRGFDQRNVGVMIDGVPVNDMENGAVYWSNWFGLDNITSNMQVQRGLGATKLAMPSVGGTINILTQTVGTKKGLTVKQEFGTGNLRRFSLTASSGTTKSGFGVLVSASYKLSDGWLDGNSSQGFFGYIKLQQKLKKHLISLSAFMAPQRHGQRSFSQRIKYWDSTYLKTELDRDVTGVQISTTSKGIRYNEHWGYRTNANGQKEQFNERENFYNKPQITLKDFWKVDDKLSISTIAYVSIGKGGGSRSNGYSNLQRDAAGQIDWDKVVQSNKTNTFFGIEVPSIDPSIDSNLLVSKSIITASMNNHIWTGLLGQFSYQHTRALEFSGGLDFRTYKGGHYSKIVDLLGGDYFANDADANTNNLIKKVGDKISTQGRENDRDGLVRWAGGFGQAEYKNDKYTAFLNMSVVTNFYKGLDYFRPKMLVLADTILYVGIDSTHNVNGVTYDKDSKNLIANQTDWVDRTGYTIKMGGSYNLDKNNTVFINAGFLSRTPQYSNVIDNNKNQVFLNSPNEFIRALEGGYNLLFKNFGVNLNGYYTKWKNKPIPFGISVPDPNDPAAFIQANVPGMDALHVGVEMAIAWQALPKLNVEIMMSYGDWRWKSKAIVQITENYEYEFDARNVHVGDAAQAVQSASLRWEPVRNFYIKPQYQYFSKYYSSFEPSSLKGDNAGRDSWKMPDYGLLNLFIGYKIPVDKYAFLLNIGVMNVMNSTYISDAQNNNNGAVTANGGLAEFNARSAGVFFGQGRRFNISMALQF